MEEAAEAMLWREDICVLVMAAKATCQLCAGEYPLKDYTTHELAYGVRVVCLAAPINRCMNERMRGLSS